MRLGQMVTRKLTAIWLIVASTCPPVNITHAVAHGDVQHSHDYGTHACEAQREHAHDPPAKESYPTVTPQLHSMADIHWHAHFVVFGIQIHVHQPHENGEQSRGDCQPPPAVYPQPANVAASQHAPDLQLTGHAIKPISVPLTSKPAASCSDRTCFGHSSPPLCDVARHERSGVQLA
jgi:hypothetical protein